MFSTAHCALLLTLWLLLSAPRFAALFPVHVYAFWAHPAKPAPKTNPSGLHTSLPLLSPVSPSEATMSMRSPPCRRLTGLLGVCARFALPHTRTHSPLLDSPLFLSSSSSTTGLRFLHDSSKSQGKSSL